MSFSHCVNLAIFVLLFFLSVPAYATDTTIFSDAFTGSSGTNLSAHSPDIGTSWTEAEDTATTGMFEIASSFNDTRPTPNTNSQRLVYAAVPASSTADMAVDFKIDLAAEAAAGNTDDSIILVVRYADTSNYYFCLMYGCNGAGCTHTAHIGEKVAGTPASLTSTTLTLAVGDIFRCEIVGTTLTFYKNGASFLTTTDASLSAAGNGGLAAGNVKTSTDDYLASAWRVDDFHVYEITGSARGAMIISQQENK